MDRDGWMLGLEARSLSDSLLECRPAFQRMRSYEEARLLQCRARLSCFTATGGGAREGPLHGKSLQRGAHWRGARLNCAAVPRRLAGAHGAAASLAPWPRREQPPL